jgi:hypothetical protein
MRLDFYQEKSIEIYIMQTTSPQYLFLLYDSQLKALISVFDDEKKADCAKKKLIVHDLVLFKQVLNTRILLNENTIEDLGKLQQISFVFKQPATRLFSTNIEYQDGISSLSRYRIYRKPLNSFDLDTSNNTDIILFH